MIFFFPFFFFFVFLPCSEGVATEKLCKDGLVFNDYSAIEEKCDLPYNIDCTKRFKLREYSINGAINGGSYVSSRMGGGIEAG